MHKGGSGKTTTAINLATALHQKGKRTLLVDLDPQANATSGVGINPLRPQFNVNHLFTTAEIGAGDVITQAPSGLHVIPSHLDLGRTESGMKGSEVVMLRGLLKDIEGNYDFIIIDTPPREGLLAVNALALADGVIIPLQAHYWAMEGLAAAIDQVAKVKEGLNPGIRIIGILPTMMNARTILSKQVLEAAREAYPNEVYPFTVDFSIKHPEAATVGQPIVLYDPSHQGALAYHRLAETLL